VLGALSSWFWLALLIAGSVAAVLLQRPVLGLIVLIVVALAIRLDIPTGSQVVLNPVTLFLPALLVIFLLTMLRRKDVRLSTNRVFLPLALFLLINLISLLVGNATWDPSVPRSSRFIVVQLAQWSLYVFSAVAFWLSANLIKDKRWLWLLTASFLIIAGVLAILYVLPGSSRIVFEWATIAVVRPPFWILLAAVAGGQLLFNRHLSRGWRLYLMLLLVAVVFYSFYLGRESASNWIGVGVAAAVLVWLRWPRLRWIALTTLLIFAALGLLIPTVWNFAGGEIEWQASGGSRLVLVERVLQVTMRNPLTGLGPAAYRNYAAVTPLIYRGAFWVQPQVSSHNNYVDIFSQAGLIGLGLFLWFAIEWIVLAMRLRNRFKDDVSAGYVNGMLATGAGAVVIMILADWILPFVYNIGFAGFQASVLVWLFMGGVVALDQIPEPGDDP
jgi:O-antigen ligase